VKDKGWDTCWGGMANVVYCNFSNLFNNNYYSALATPNRCNPTHLSLAHTGIANLGTSGIYFLPSAPVSNLNLQAPTVGVQVANGLPEKSFASPTLALVPSLPPAAIQGHVMSSFPHTLIGWGPFADLGCAIMFTKTGVTVVDPAGRCILKGWQERDGPRLWCFPLKAAKPSLPVLVVHDIHEGSGTRVSAAGFSQPVPATPINAAAPSLSVPLPGGSRGGGGGALGAQPASQPRHPGHWLTWQSLLCPLPLQGHAGHGLGGQHLQHNF
jgi:hypothetical protein